MTEIAKINKEVSDHKEFLDRFEAWKVDFFQNRIFVFTPNGDVIDLPEEATPVDFAYAIHTDIGNSMTSVRVNDDIAPLSRPLVSGDVVEIITDKKRKHPSSDWMKFVKTHNAKSKIKAHMKAPFADILNILMPNSKKKVREEKT